MNAQFVTSTKPSKNLSVMDQKERMKFKSEYQKQDAQTPFRLFVAMPGKPKVHLFRTLKGGLEGFDEYKGVNRILMDMRNGAIKAAIDPRDAVKGK